MAFRKPKKQPQFADLKGILAQSKDTDNALYQTVQVLIERLGQFQSVTLEQVADINNSINISKKDEVPPTLTVDIIVREVPSGSLNGINTTFILANMPILNSEQVYLNGLLQDVRGVDYSISGPVITFLIPPISTDRILVTYQKV